MDKTIDEYSKVLHRHDEALDFSEVPQTLRRKIKKYYAHLLKKHRNWTLVEIRNKVAEKFKITFEE